VFVVLARTIWEDGRDAGMSACLVERRGNEERIAATPLHDKMGMWRSDTAALKFDDVPVADNAILGPLGSGGKVARRVLWRGRVGIGALALGLARDSLERAAAYAKGRAVAGGALFDQPLTRAKLSRMQGSLWIAWQAVCSAARLADESKPFKVQASMSKVFATETALRIIDEAVQILGGYGYMRDYKVEQNYRDARLLTIGEGASEILRFAIARNLCEANADYANALPSLESLADAVGPCAGSKDDIWGASWRALELAAAAVQLVRQQIAQEGQPADATWDWQCRAVGFADLATRLWVSTQVILHGAKLVNRGGASQKLLKLIKTFLIDSSIEICHQASEFLRTQGLTDASLLGDYAEALQIGARFNAPSPLPLTVEEP